MLDKFRRDACHARRLMLVAMICCGGTSAGTWALADQPSASTPLTPPPGYDSESVRQLLLERFPSLATTTDATHGATRGAKPSSFGMVRQTKSRKPSFPALSLDVPTPNEPKRVEPKHAEPKSAIRVESEPAPSIPAPSIPAPSIASPETGASSGPSLSLSDPVTTGAALANPSPEAAIYVHRIREMAHMATQHAKESLQRGATHSARRYATEALRLAVEMQDAANGGNEHTRSLTTALDAIRESKDFCGQYGSVDARVLTRMVAVHETSVLKEADLSTMSSLQATEAYLQVAKDALVQAAGGSDDACDSLVMLGVVEKRLASENDPHAGAVAMTMHRAAVEISDRSPVAYRELGNTFMSQGLYPQAAWSFEQSVRLRPSRSSYQNLLEASRKTGDSETSRRCVAALDDPNLPSGIAIKTLTPDAFAASFRPDPSSMPVRTASTPKPASEPKLGSDPEPTKESGRSFLGFGRR